MSKAKKDIDINDIDAMLEDMKNLAMETPKEEVKEEMEIVSEKVEETSASIPREEVTEITLPEPENKLVYVDLSIPMEDVETDVDSEVVEEVQVEEAENAVDEIEGVLTEVEKKEEDLSFLEDAKEEETEKEIVKQEQKSKPRRKVTYQEMFGGTWRGYGYDHF